MLYCIISITKSFLCKDIIFESNGSLYTVLIDTANPSRVKTVFNWKVRCGEPIQSIYLPQRPGTQTSDFLHNYEVIHPGSSGRFIPATYFDDKVKIFNLLFLCFCKEKHRYQHGYYNRDTIKRTNKYSD